MIRSNHRQRDHLIRGAVVAAMLAAGLPALAEQGGDPTNRTSISEWLKASRTVPAPGDAKVVEAAAPAISTKRFYDKTEAEWRAYHAEMREFQRRNTGR